jgi:hypothetical protein
MLRPKRSGVPVIGHLIVSAFALSLVVQSMDDGPRSSGQKILLAEQAAKAASAGQGRKKSAQTPDTRPITGSPEWQREEAAREKREKALNRTLSGICRGC